MVPTSCLADIEPERIALLTSVLSKVGTDGPPALARLNVAELGTLTPSLLLCDVDALAVDPLEMLRQIRFVLPECVIAVYTANVTRAWAMSCHLAGANCLLAKKSTKAALVTGLTDAMSNGCFTDPRFGDDKTERGAAS